MPDDRFGVQNDPACINIGFSLSSLFREEGIWRKGTTNFSDFFHPATWQSRSISSYAGQAAAQRRDRATTSDSFHATEQENKSVA